MKMKEDDVTELKREITKDTMKTVVAFSNTHGGKIYIGVDDKGTVFGVDDTDEVSNYIAQLLAGNVHPDVVMSSEVRTVKIEDKDVIMITVREGTSKPYYLREKGPRPEGVYIRNGPTSVQASQSMILKMVRENSPHTFESALSVDQDLTFRQASRIFQESGSKFGDPQMRSMGLKIADGYTNLAYLLSDQCEQGIKLAVFNDTTKSTFKDRTETYGSVLEQAEEAYRFIDKYNPLRTEITGLRR
ncbi:MAG: putative DNA binding domain-containing protein, partial [Methanomassiliicoccaceae archaeon]|nr:putative DNA binding domain-containing protein [Methanomassiliicoccaceae archaeon]